MSAQGRGAVPVVAGSVFVTGTDTGVGKTLVSCALIHALAQRGLRVAGMKPVAAGAQCVGTLLHNDDVDALVAAAGGAFALQDVGPYVLENALAPHIAARIEGVSIRMVTILQAYERLRMASDAVVVEGVGGFCVPLGPDGDTADLAQRLGLPVVLVVALRLGCLNHAALTAEAIRSRGLWLVGWVGNRIQEQPMEREVENVTALGEVLAAPCLGCVPWLARADPLAASTHLDVAPLLAGN